jgi:hypothetical protein
VCEREIRQHAHLLLLPQRKETDTWDLDDLEADTGDITLGLTATTEAGDEDLVVLVDEVKATVVLEDRPKSRIAEAKWSETHRHEGGDLLAVLDELHTHALADGGVGLLSLDADLLKDNALGVGRATGRRRLEDVAERALLVALVRLGWGSAPASRAGRAARTQRFSLRSRRSLRAAWRPRGLLEPMMREEVLRLSATRRRSPKSVRGSAKQPLPTIRHMIAPHTTFLVSRLLNLHISLIFRIMQNSPV